MWKTMTINKNMIKAETDKAVLIEAPHKSDFDGWAFWFPSKCVHDSKNPAAVSISYKDDFVFRLRKYGKGKFNKHTVLDEIPLAADEIEEIFDTVNANATPAEEKPMTHIPEQIAPKHIEADESLVDYD